MKKDKEPLTILGCMSEIVEHCCTTVEFNDSKFNPEVFETCKDEIKFVCDMVGITPEQALLLSNIIENKGRRHFDRRDLANAMGMSYIKLMAYDGDIRRLAEMRLINTTEEEGISVGNKTIPALLANTPYSIPVMSGLNSSQVLKEMNEIITAREDEETDYNTMLKDLDSLFENNADAEIVKRSAEVGFTVGKMPIEDRTVFYNLVKRYIYDNDDEVRWADFNDILEDASDVGRLNSLFNGEAMEIQRKKIVEPLNEDGMASPDSFHLTDEVKSLIFAEVGGVRKRSRRCSLKVMPASEITPKKMYYNDAEGEQIRRLTDLLQQDNYKATCNRLKASGMRTGFTCIFYGGPGTGKSESVYQIARATGRGIINVNVSEIKSCWVGESEKLMKGLFDEYKALAKEAEVAPILLFNEADAIFGIRQEGAQRAVEKMENSVQNIILQEMEKLEGILIATTNLTQNLDKAFERRFLYKIKFNKPCVGAKSEIWKSMIPGLSVNEAEELAKRYDFSGGQIENISRKKMIMSILDGKEPGFEEIKGYCGEELLEGHGGDGKKIGFQ